MISASPTTSHPSEPTADPPSSLASHVAEPGNTLAHVAWAHFRGDRLAMAGLFSVILLFLVAILSPFLANNKPYYLVSVKKTEEAPPTAGSGAEVPRTIVLEKQHTFPLLHSLTREDLRWLLYPVLAVMIWAMRRRQSAKELLLLAILGVGLAETLVSQHRNISDMRDYRALVNSTTGSAYAWMPPIPFNPLEQEGDILLPPNWTNWMGTDHLGRDITSRLVHASRISLTVGFVATSISIGLGLLVGSLAGFYRGWTDIVLSRVIEIMECFPTMFLILAVLAFLQPSLFNIMLVIGFTSWTGVARLVRGEFLRLSEQPFAMAASALGASDRRIILLHILPNAMGPILVSATFGVASSILMESGLSFLGMGVQPPTPTWGDMLAQARDGVVSTWWLAVFPGIMIFITITAYNLVGQGIRDAMDPRLRE
ncbi:MAG: ABC transporter permease [Candidatus Methylacidiphilales bacterium]